MGEYNEPLGTNIPKIARGQTWCIRCGNTKRLNGVDTLNGQNGGWPKCCGYTMTIDSPKERALLTRLNGEG